MYRQADGKGARPLGIAGNARECGALKGSRLQGSIVAVTFTPFLADRAPASRLHGVERAQLVRPYAGMAVYHHRSSASSCTLLESPAGLISAGLYHEQSSEEARGLEQLLQDPVW